MFNISTKNSFKCCHKIVLQVIDVFKLLLNNKKMYAFQKENSLVDLDSVIWQAIYLHHDFQSIWEKIIKKFFHPNRISGWSIVQLSSEALDLMEFY